MADNVNVTPGSGVSIAADEVIDGTLGTVKVQYVKIMDGTLDGTSKVAVGSNGLKVDGSAIVQPVSAASLPLPNGAATASLQTQPGVDIGDVTVNNGSGGSAVNVQDGGNSLTVDGSVNVSNFPSSQPVTGTFWQTTQPISGSVSVSNLPAVQPVSDNSGSLTIDGAVSVTNFPVTQPVSGTFWQATQPVSGTLAVTESGTWTVQPGNTANTTPWLTGTIPASLVISTTAATGVAVTATLPAVASQFHYITLIEITKIFTAANAASATPLLVTTTNLPGSYAFSFGQPLGTIGSSEERIYQFENPLKSSVLNTNTTIVCPATTGIIWRINVHYYSAT